MLTLCTPDIEKTTKNCKIHHRIHNVTPIFFPTSPTPEIRENMILWFEWFFFFPTNNFTIGHNLAEKNRPKYFCKFLSISLSLSLSLPPPPSLSPVFFIVLIFLWYRTGPEIKMEINKVIFIVLVTKFSFFFLSVSPFGF